MIEVELSITGCRLPKGDKSLTIPVLAHTFQSGTGVAFPPEQLHVNAQVTGRHSASVFLTVIGRDRVDAGKYAGVVSLDNKERYGTGLDIPVEIDVQYHNWLATLLLSSAACLVFGTVLVWFRSKTGPQGDHSSQTLWAWITQLGTWVAIATAGTAAFTAWLSGFWNDPTWGGDLPNEWWKLIAAMFVAYTAAFTATSAIADRVAPGAPTPPAPTDDAEQEGETAGNEG